MQIKRRAVLTVCFKLVVGPRISCCFALPWRPWGSCGLTMPLFKLFNRSRLLFPGTNTSAESFLGASPRFRNQPVAINHRYHWICQNKKTNYSSDNWPELTWNDPYDTFPTFSQEFLARFLRSSPKRGHRLPRRPRRLRPLRSRRAAGALRRHRRRGRHGSQPLHRRWRRWS